MSMNRTITPHEPPLPPDRDPHPPASGTRRGYGCAIGYLLVTALCLMVGSLTTSSCETFFGWALGPCVPSVAVLLGLPWSVLAGIPSMETLLLAYGLNTILCLLLGRWIGRRGDRLA